ncbi:MAG: AAA family ATPase, partial [Actinobacteria bacterium]|nr:AAA family ATPase [Actinomycetota bacterium]
MFIDKLHLSQHLRKLLHSFRAVELVGPRQVGKTTIARQFVHPDSANYFDLEDPVSRQRLSNPMTALGDLQGLIVIDEIQHL